MSKRIIHKEGFKIISFITISLVLINLIGFLFITQSYLSYIILLISILFLAFVLRFFRVPNRLVIQDETTVYSPADGKVVVVEEVFEGEYLKTKCIQISVFMSVWNVHINWSPVNGLVSYYKYHPGQYLVARHPKSSELNERNSLVIKTTNNVEILVRQIAGFVARRIVSYAKPEKHFSQSSEIGFIKFGSRVDVFLPINTEILVKPGDKVTGTISKLALLK
ncbi:MAG: phosphatidylserine decarboxylase family protein [Bacteroidales bacterium]|nr:phosphatidylserine decarboxylase family protein [Bacteroidales bacterium]MCF8390239.1 phosphatidylserine decarboxylase family protein [Bacteroidales bacterium]